GLRVGFRVSDARALPAVLDRLPAGWHRAPSPVVPHVYSLIVGGEGPRPGVRRLSLAYANATRIARASDPEEAVGAIESHLRMSLAARRRRWVFPRADTVEWRGQAVVLAGPAGSGKPSLARALVRAGARPHSESYAAIDRRGRVRCDAAVRPPAPIGLV